MACCAVQPKSVQTDILPASELKASVLSILQYLCEKQK